MVVSFFDRQDDANPLNGSVIAGEEQLSGIFGRLKVRSPFFCELVGDNGHNLLIGVGGMIGCVQHSRADGGTPYLMAAAADGGDTEGCETFLIGNTATPVPRRYGLPFHLVQEIAAHFLRTGERSPAVLWEDI